MLHYTMPYIEIYYTIYYYTIRGSGAQAKQEYPISWVSETLNPRREAESSAASAQA